MSLLSKNLKISNKEQYPIAWQKKIDLVQECMDELASKLEHENVNIHERKVGFGEETNIDIIFRGDLKELSDKLKTVSTYVYEFAEAIYHVRRLDYDLKNKLYEVINKTLTPKLIEDSAYKITNFNLQKYEKDTDYKKPTFWQKLIGKRVEPNDYMVLYVRVDKKK